MSTQIRVQIVQHLQPGGIETMALALADKHPENTYIVSLQGRYEQALRRWPRLEKYRSRLIFMDKQPGIRPGLVWQLAALLKQLNASVVHTHHIGPLMYGGLAARLARVPHCIHTEHDAWHLSSIRRRMIERALLSVVKPRLVADANIVLSSMRRLGIRYPAVVIPNGIDTDKFHRGNRLNALKALDLQAWVVQHQNRTQQQGKNLMILGCAGRLVAEKGYQHLISAMSHLPDYAVLLIAGDGPARADISRQAEQAGVAGRVHLLGAVNEMSLFYQCLDVFVMASLNEGLPLSPLEAQACNVPVVLTDVGGCREAICPDTGLLVQAGDGESLAWGIRKQMRNVQLFTRCQQRQSPRSFVAGQRDLSGMVSAYDHLLNS